MCKWDLALIRELRVYDPQIPRFLLVNREQELSGIKGQATHNCGKRGGLLVASFKRNR